jgi:multidrug transporter EmrE-like cation transporter
MREFIVSWGLVFLSALFDSYAAFIVKTQFNKLGKMQLDSFSAFFEYIYVFFQNPILLTAIATFVAAPAMWFIALNRLDLSIAYPVLVGFHLIFVLFFGVAFLGEGMSLNKAIGCVLVLSSLYFFYSK